MDPSSLIFVVIVGIWAIYLMQHWVRRREQLAIAHGVDQFSEDLRVLERRVPIPVTSPSRSAPAVRPEVAMNAPVRHQTQAPVQAPHAAPRRTHRLRALILLTLIVATPAVWAAHIFGTLLLVPTVAVSVLCLLDLMLVRSAVRRERIRRRRAVQSTRPAARPSVGTPRGVDPRRTKPQRQRPVAQPQRFVVSTPAERVPVAAGAVNAVAVAVDLKAPAPVHSQDAPTEIIVLEGEWQPVPVPRPTYTMKAKAERPVSRSGVQLEAESDSAPVRPPVQPAIQIDEFDLDTVLERRRAAGA